ncbi:Methyl-accepting chemotaxis protein, partial [Pseudomonas syringae pv. berberidis]
MTATSACVRSTKKCRAGASPRWVPRPLKSCQLLHAPTSSASKSWSVRLSISFRPVLTATKLSYCVTRSADPSPSTTKRAAFAALFAFSVGWIQSGKKVRLVSRHGACYKDDRKVPSFYWRCGWKDSPVSAVLSLLQSRLLRPVFIALGIALLVQVIVAVALTRSTVTALEADLANRLGVDSQHLSSELELASSEVTSSLDALSASTRQRLSVGLSTRLKEEQAQLRATLEKDLRESATDMAELLAAVAPRAMWDNDTPTLSEFARR